MKADSSTIPQSMSASALANGKSTAQVATFMEPSLNPEQLPMITIGPSSSTIAADSTISRRCLFVTEKPVESGADAPPASDAPTSLKSPGFDAGVLPTGQFADNRRFPTR